MRGGYRPNAGRKKERPQLPRYRPSGGALSREQIADVRQRAQAWLTEHEAPLLDRIMASGDLRLQFEAYRFIKGHGDGLAPKQIDLRVGESFESVLGEILAREEAKAAAVTVEVVADSQTTSVALVLPPKT